MSWAQGLRGGSWGSMSWAQGLRGGSWGSMSWAPFICWALLGPFICSTRNKSQMAPNEKVPSNEKLGLRAKHRVKNICLIVEIVFLQKLWKKEDQRTSIFHFADRPELPYEVDFWRNRFAQNIDFQKCWRFFTFAEGDFGRFPKYFCEFVRILAWNRDGKCC